MRNRIFLTFILLTMCACAKKSDNKGNSTPVNPLPPAEGSSSGGGSFGNESARKILSWASQDLAREIRNSSPEIYKDLPKGWSQERLAQVIADVQMTNLPEVSRYGERLMFDYRTRPDGSMYITATRLFAESYSSYAVNSDPKHAFWSELEEVKLKLAHEAAHLMGLGLTKETDMLEARLFAKRLKHAIDTDNFECLIDEFAPIELFTEEGEPVERGALSKAYLINRPTGMSVGPHNWEHPPCSDEKYIHGCEDPDNPVTTGVLRTPGLSLGYLSEDLVYQALLWKRRNYSFMGVEMGPFSWKQVDPRKAVWTPSGFKSGFDYGHSFGGGAIFTGFLDFQIVESDLNKYIVRAHPGFRQDSPFLRYNLGAMRFEIRLNDGEVSSAKIVVTRSFWPRYSGVGFDYHRGEVDIDDVPGKIHMETGIRCQRVFTPLRFPRKTELPVNWELEDLQ